MSTSFNDAPPSYRRRLSSSELSTDEDLPLPNGWIKQFDQSSSRYYYTDTHADPPRSTWDHPSEDEQWQRENGRRSRPFSPSPVDGKGRQLPERKERNTLERSRPDYSNQAMASSSTSGFGGDQLGAKPKQGFFGKVVSGAMWVVDERSAAKERKQDAKQNRRQQKRGMGMGQRYLDRGDMIAQPSYYPSAQYSNTPVYVDNGHQIEPIYGPSQQVYSQPNYVDDRYSRRDRGQGLGGRGLIGGIIGGLILGEIL
ncbi:hypothetical protein FRB94_004948 [Tulasnella sp. JGI-2019a]|nr:hypothetical protein FRB93_001497 [Tulasnella sp. JGI-2019a]KAG9001055.1 hypothetical protein FRB94_004948 [Tulasnella sp. JGI-2019a]